MCTLSIAHKHVGGIAQKVGLLYGECFSALGSELQPVEPGY